MSLSDKIYRYQKNNKQIYFRNVDKLRRAYKSTVVRDESNLKNLRIDNLK